MMRVEAGQFTPNLALLMVAGLLIVLILARALQSPRRRFDVKVCPRCGENHPNHAAFCGQCGTRLGC